jgi:hypothetical protein
MNLHHAFGGRYYIDKAGNIVSLYCSFIASERSYKIIRGGVIRVIALLYLGVSQMLLL